MKTTARRPDEIIEGEEGFALAAIQRTARALTTGGELATSWRRLVDAGTPDTTKRARQGALRYFEAWAGLVGVPERELVARGLRRKVGPVAVATVEARVAHLATAHRLAGLEANPCRDPRIVEALKAARKLRTRTGGQRVKAAVTRDVLDTMLSECVRHRRCRRPRPGAAPGGLWVWRPAA